MCWRFQWLEKIKLFKRKNGRRYGRKRLTYANHEVCNDRSAIAKFLGLHPRANKQLIDRLRPKRSDKDSGLKVRAKDAIRISVSEDIRSSDDIITIDRVGDLKDERSKCS